MLEFISGVFIGYMLNWWAIIGTCILCAFSVHTDSRFFSVFFLGLFGLIVYNMFSMSLEQLMYYTIGYVVVGFLWSFWRYKKFVREEVEKFNNRCSGMSEYQRNEEKEYMISQLDVSKHTDKIVFWIVVFPFSMAENLLGDIIDLFIRVVTVYMKSVYAYIMQSELKDIK